MKKLMLTTMAIFVMLALVGCKDEPETPPSPTVTSVTVSPATPTVEQGKTQQFTAAVTGQNNPKKTVTWTVEGGKTGTSISSGGLLTVAADENTTGTLTVKATSTVDKSKSGSATVTVKAPATVTTVTVTGGATSIKQGETSAAFTASVTGTNSPGQTVTWSLVAETTDTALGNSNITIVETSKVKVADAATVGTKFRVKATSTVDTSKSGFSSVITVADKTAPTNDVKSLTVDATAASVKKEYFVGDLLDPTDVVVTATYDDDTTSDVTDNVTWSPEKFTTSGATVTVTATFTDNGKSVTGTYTVKVDKKTLNAADFSIETDYFMNNMTQNIRNEIVPVVIVYNGDSADIGAITVLYDEDDAVPNKAGSYPLTIEVAASDMFEAAEFDLEETLTIEEVALIETDFAFDKSIKFEDSQLLVADATADLTLAVTWAASKIWNTNGTQALTVHFEDASGATTLPTAFVEAQWYSIVLTVAALADYHSGISLQLGTFEVVTARLPKGHAEITIIGWNFKDEADIDIAGGEVSKTGAVKTKDITIASALFDTFDTVEWYLDGVKDSSANDSDTYTFDSATLKLGGPYFVTLRVEVDSKWYSKTIIFTVNP